MKIIDGKVYKEVDLKDLSKEDLIKIIEDLPKPIETIIYKDRYIDKIEPCYVPNTAPYRSGLELTCTSPINF